MTNYFFVVNIVIECHYRSGLPKKTQLYIFFQIVDVTKFRADLARFVPLIKTVAGVLKDRDLIKKHKKKGHKTLIPLVGVNIAFSHLGFVKVISLAIITCVIPLTMRPVFLA